jgi:hypothetical protein
MIYIPQRTLSTASPVLFVSSDTEECDAGYGSPIYY